MTTNKSIITEHEGIPVLENTLGCKLVPYHGETGWGLGTFYVDDVQIGDTLTCFFEEETVIRSYMAQGYKILSNDAEKGEICFFGKDGKIAFEIVISLSNTNSAYNINYTFDPIHPIFHSVFVRAPFYSEKISFVKYPYEDTIFKNPTVTWSVNTDKSRAPFLFGKEILNGKDYFVGVGYSLNEKFDEGRFEYNPIENQGAPFKVFSPFKGMSRATDLQCVTKLELLHVDLEEDYKQSSHHFSLSIATAKSQFACIRSFIDACGYDKTIKIRNSIDDSVNALMKLYKNIPGYVEGKGYHQLVRVDTGDFDTTVPHGWYSKYLVTGPQVQLGFELYKYWQKNKSETWARERAIEMANFLLQMQNEQGAFSNWDTDLGGNAIMHPDNVEGTEFNSCIYTISDIALGAYHLYLLADAMYREESIKRPDWEDAAEKAVAFIANQVKENGELGRNYDLSGRYDKLGTGTVMALFAMDYVFEKIGDEKLKDTKERLEQWLYREYIQYNNWADGCIDGGAWQGGDWPPPHNNDTLGILPFASYCVQMHQKTGDEHYIQMASDVIGYQWLTMVPIEIPGFKYGTRGLSREQDFYSTFDVPFRIDEFNDCLPYLSKVTGDPFFMQFYRILLQTQMDYQEREKPYAGFHIGLECNTNGREPLNKLAERNSCYIVRFASMFLKSVSSPMCYRYVGGEGWGFGIDYNLPFIPDFGPAAPYVMSCTSMVRNITWETERQVLEVLVYDKKAKQGILEVKWTSLIQKISNIKIDINGEVSSASDYYIESTQTIRIPYQSKDPSCNIRIFYK